MEMLINSVGSKMPLVHRMKVCPECKNNYEITYLQVGDQLVAQNVLRSDLPGDSCPHCEEEE
jgi:hypothetical protein